MLAIFSMCKVLTDGVSRFATVVVCSDAPVRVFSCCPLVPTVLGSCPLVPTVLGSCCGRSSLLPVAKTCKLSLLSAIFGVCKPLVDCVSRSAAVAACPNGSVCAWASCPMVSTTSGRWSGCCSTLLDAKTRGIALLTRSSVVCKPVFALHRGLQRVSAIPFVGVRVSQRFPLHPDVGLDVVEGPPTQKQ